MFTDLLICVKEYKDKPETNETDYLQGTDGNVARRTGKGHQVPECTLSTALTSESWQCFMYHPSPKKVGKNI